MKNNQINQKVKTNHALIAIYKFFLVPHPDYGDIIYNQAFNIMPY